MCPGNSLRVAAMAHMFKKKRPREEEQSEYFEEDVLVGTVVDHGNAMLSSTKLRKLDAADPGFKVVHKVFLDGMGMGISPDGTGISSVVTSIYKVDYTDAVGKARVESFRKRRCITQDARGDADIQGVWYGCSKEELLSIVNHGFGVPKKSDYGIGVYLSPIRSPSLSAAGADVDDKGEQHLLLCQVILGKRELVERGSTQFHPSNEAYDTGVDNLGNPKRHIVWSTHMNTNILPVYAISFKLPRSRETPMKNVGIPRTMGCYSPRVKHQLSGGTSTPNYGSPRTQRPSPGQAIPNPKLFSLLEPQLPPSDMQLLLQHYADYKNGKIPLEKLLGMLRTIAGDSTLRKIQEQVLGGGRNNLLCYGFCQNVNKKMRCA